jgi:hypothetical protein
MRKLLVIFLLLSNLSLLYAKGVSAGTVIKNSVSLDFIIGSESFKIKSNIYESIVDQLIDVKVSWMDTTEVSVSKGEKKRVLSFKVLNSGNAKDRFNLFADELKNRSNFNLARKRIYLDTNNNLYFDPKDRVRKTVTLDADDESLVFVVSDISDTTNAPSQSKNYINFKAISRKGGSGIKGKVYRKKGLKNSDAIDGLSGGVGEDEGIYKLLIATVVMDKKATIKDDLITVSIDVTLSGEGSVKKVFIKDDIPNETKYIKNSLKLNGISLSDKSDTDKGQYKRKYKDREAYIRVKLGEVFSLDHFIITYNLEMR